MSLVEKYRPNEFKDIIGQEHIVKVLNNIIENQEKYPKNFLFVGQKGTGKTSSARAFFTEMKKIKKTTYCKEYDITTTNKIDDIKDIKSYIETVLTLSKATTILIFDEIHRATNQAQQVFLKLLEDYSKSNIYFIFTTTSIQNIIDTFIDRCIEFNFNLISNTEIINRLNYIIKNEKIEIDEKFLHLIVDKSGNRLRTAIKLLDLYNISKSDFNLLLLDCTDILKNVLFNNSDTNSLKIYPLNILLNDLNKFFEKYVSENIEKDFLFISQFLEIYLKYKNYIETIEDFISVIKLLNNFIKRRQNGKI